MMEWPEPIIRITDLAQSGISTIPERYIKSHSQRPTIAPTVSHQNGLNHGVTDADISIPVIDLQHLSVGDQCLREETMRHVSVECGSDFGFFPVLDHGVNHELMRRARELWRGFFNLLVEVKEEYANSPTTYEGYGSRLGVTAIAQSGISTIPERFIKPHSQRPTIATTVSHQNGLNHGVTDADINIPVIDLQYLSGGDQCLPEEIIRCVSVACREYGSFQVPGVCFFFCSQKPGDNGFDYDTIYGYLSVLLVALVGVKYQALSTDPFHEHTTIMLLFLISIFTYAIALIELKLRPQNNTRSPILRVTCHVSGILASELLLLLILINPLQWFIINVSSILLVQALCYCYQYVSPLFNLQGWREISIFGWKWNFGRKVERETANVQIEDLEAAIPR